MACLHQVGLLTGSLEKEPEESFTLCAPAEPQGALSAASLNLTGTPALLVWGKVLLQESREAEAPSPYTEGTLETKACSPWLSVKSGCKCRDPVRPN